MSLNSHSWLLSSTTAHFISPCLLKNKMQHNLWLRSILFTAACSRAEQVLKLVITEQAWARSIKINNFVNNFQN